VNKLIYTAFVIAWVLLHSCQNTSWKIAENGEFSYQIYPANIPSPTLTFGDQVRYYYKLQKGEKILKNSFGNLDSLTIPAREYRNIIEQGLVLCKVGDSLVIKFRYQQLQSYLPQYQKELNPTDELIFSFKIISFIPKAELDLVENSDFASEKGFTSLEAMQQERKNLLVQAQIYLNQLEIHTKNGLSDKKTMILESMKNNNPLEQYTAQTGDTVAVYYALSTQPEGNIFDQNLQTADRFLFVINQDLGLLAGFHQSAQQLKVGEAAYFFINSKNGYGAEGSLPVVQPNQNLGLFMKMAVIWKQKNNSQQ
jgi:FKBP-type peptidyl-prolyl cis-trans isomerase